MNDLMYIGFFFACCASAVGLVALLDRLLPLNPGPRTGAKP